MIRQISYKFLLIIVAAGIIGTMVLTIAFALPTERIQDHVHNATKTFEQEKTYFSITSGVEGTQIDNYTEAIYLNQAMVSGDPFKCAISGYTFQIPDKKLNPVENLNAVIEKPFEAVLDQTCVRFFNGYEIVIKPLLMLTKYGQIRQINLYAVFALFMLLCYLMLKNNLGIYIVPFTLAFLYINPVTISVTLTFVFFYYCSIIPCIIILLFNDYLKRGYRYYFFFEVVGVCAFYFNMNYFQLITFGFPLTFYYLINGLPLKWTDVITKSLSFLGVWFLGYVGIMLFKWILYAALYDHDFFAKMFAHAQQRLSDHQGDVSFSRWQAVNRNMKYVIMNWSWLIMEIVFTIICVYNWYKEKAYNIIHRNKLKAEVAFVFFMILLPLLRYFIYANHVMIHHWVTYRIFSISILVFNVFLVKYCYGKIGEYELT